MLYLQECTNCKAVKPTCGPDIDKWENITKDDCFAKIKNERYQLLEYQVKEQRCKAYNCTKVRWGIRFSTRTRTGRSGESLTIRYTFTSNNFINNSRICNGFETES